jgi:Tol biopolymer transport system component
MNEPTRLSDREITDMLRRRSARPAPDGLASAVLESLASERARHPVRTAGRSAKRPLVLLAAAALLLVGGAMAAGSGLVRLPSVVPPVPAPTNPVAVATPTAVPTAVPSAAVVQPASGLILFKTRLEGAGIAPANGPSWIAAANGPLWIANADGTGKHELIPGSCEGWPSWSPDGTRLLISRMDPPGSRPSAADPCGFFVNLGDPGTRLYLTDASGSAPQLVDTGCVDPCVSEINGVFSSDGRRILFVRVIEVPDPSATGIAGKPAPKMQVGVLATMDLATGRVTELAHLPGGSWVAWSPDRTQIVYGRDTLGPRNSPPLFPPVTVVIVADADGGNARQVSPSGWESQSAGWSPDGSLILFQRNRYTATGAYDDIYTVRPDGSDLRQLTTDGISSNPAWGVDGRIWFVRTPKVDAKAQTSPPSVTWVMDADGGNATQSSLGPQPQDLADTARQPTP